MKKKLTVSLLIIIILFTGFMTHQTNIAAQSEKGTYVGSVESDKYHYPGCRWAKNINPENEIWFKTIEEAQNKGYKPCGTCF